ncbi:MAG: MotA/TolQ/ExbB proton channel family protein [Planctomycetaceae bacterium]|nr:MotA/TolQ/ExbB proton channel family protein [Planctomycetaceae bacterium]
MIGLGNRREKTQWLAIVALALGIALTASWGVAWLETTPTVWAQDAPAEGAAQPADGADPAAGPKRVYLLQWIYEALGITYILVFMILSFTLGAFFVMNFLSSRRGTICPPQLAEQFEQQLDAKQYQEAYETAKADESFLGQVLAAGMARLQSGYAKSIEAMQEVGEDEAMKLEHRLSYMDLIARIAPMVGLFGTVDGMIRAFQKISESGGTPDPTRLAMDIATALVTTLLGLAIAIPAMVAYTVLRNHVHRLVLEVGMTAQELMNRFESVSTEKRS